MEEFEPDLKVRQRGSLQIIIFNRPSKKNALGIKIYQGVKKALQIATENDKITITVLIGTGDYYTSGTDVMDMGNTNNSFEDIINEKLGYFKEFIRALIDYPKLLIAVVNGPAVGIGVTTLGLCDIVIATENATFHTPFTSLGITAEGCSSYTFPRIMGPSLAGKMLYFNYKMTAREAKNCGFVGEVVKKKELNNVLDGLTKLAELTPKSLLYNKKLMKDSERDLLHSVNNREVERLYERFGSEEFINALIKIQMKKKSKL